jgi:hypothetical protein
VILVSRMFASIYFSVLYMAMFYFTQLKNFNSAYMVSSSQTPEKICAFEMHRSPHQW